MHRFRQIASLIRGALVGVGGSGFLIAGAVLTLVGLLLIPLPRSLLDILLVFNLVVALILLLVGLFIKEVRQLYTFPTILLLSTLFRLALNVSSTRLILLNGDSGRDAAGQVIEAFGNFVVQGDFVVGAIIFAIVAVVNFVVIAKGSARVAEVSARFTLDAMPGKQLAIDSDLRSGSVSKDEAQRERQRLTEESQFYGAMDGAMRFVQGDAIAGFIITFINAVGGVSIGISRGLSFGDAVDTFGLLTIGDGLVSILPSLLVSVCAGIVVTRVRSTDVVTQQQTIVSELAAQPQAIVIASLVLLALGIVPGLPLIPFVTVGLLLLLAAGWLMSAGRRGYQTIDATIISEGSAQSAYGALPAAAASLGLPAGADLAALEAPQALTLAVGASVFDRIFGSSEQQQGFRKAEAAWRKRLYREKGLPLPEIHLSRSDNLPGDGFVVSVRDEEVRSGKISSESYFVAMPSKSLEMLGIRAQRSSRHPLTLVGGSWLERGAAGRDALRRLDVEIFSPAEYLVLEAVRAFSDMIETVFGLDELKRMVERLAERHPGLCAEVFSAGVISYSEFADIIRRLVRERVNVRDLKVIIEGVAEFRSHNLDAEDRQQWLDGLHGFLRRVLSRKIVSSALAPGGHLRMFVLSREVEDEFQSAASMWDGARTRPPIEPTVERQLRQNAETMFAPVLARGMSPVVLVCSADIRPAVNEFFAYQLDGRDWFRTVAFEELDGTVPVESVGVLGAERTHA